MNRSTTRPSFRPERLEGRRLLAAVSSVDFDYGSFTDSNTAELDLGGDADVVNGRLRVSPDVQYSQGNVFTDDKLVFDDDTGFSTTFSFNIGGGDRLAGGDGLVFVLWGGDGEAPLPGFPGGSLGYAGLWPGVAVEFDSAESFGDPASDHVALHVDGNSAAAMDAQSVAIVNGDLNDGRTRWAWIDYDATSDRLRVYLNDQNAKPSVPLLNRPIDLPSFTRGEAHIGLTAASGYFHNRHDVLSWSFQTLLPGTDNADPVADDDSYTVTQNSGNNPLAVLANDSDTDGDSLVVTGASGASNGTVSTDGTRVFYKPNLGFAGTDAFTYTVTDGRGGSDSATVSVTVEQALASGTFQLGSGSYTVDEGAGFVDITVNRVGGSDGTATLDFNTGDISATGGLDYQARSGTLRFEPGETTQTLRINLSDDTLNEGDEAFFVSLDAVTGANLGAPRTAQIVITDNDQPPPVAGDLPWLEQFNLPNGTQSDSGTTGWQLSGTSGNRAEVQSNRLRVSNTGPDTAARFTSDPISVGADGPAVLSLVLSASGDMEGSGQWVDFVEVRYQDETGQVVLLERLVDNFGNITRSYDGIDADVVTILIDIRTTASSEVYYIDNVSLASEPDVVAPTPMSFYDQAENAAASGSNGWTELAGGSGGGSVRWDGTKSTAGPASSPLEFDFSAPSAGLYTVDLRLDSGGGGANSFWVRVDGADVSESDNISRSDGWVRFNGLPDTNGLQWFRVYNDQANDETVSFFLPAGDHTLQIAGRENGIRLDGVYVTNTDDAPSTDDLDEIPGDDTVTPPAPTGEFRRTDIVIGGISSVTDVKYAGSLGDVVYAAERAGRIRLVVDGDLISTPFVDITDDVNGTRDRGLLAIELDPNFPTEPYVYAMYTYDPPEAASGSGLAARDANGNRAGRVVRFTADASTGYRTAVPNSQEVIVGKRSTWDNISGPDKDSTGRSNFDLPASGTPEDPRNNGQYVNDFIASDSQSHSVGDLAFGADGNLYITTGDATSYGAVDPRTKYVQDLDTLRGKVLRVDPDTGRGLSDNPFWTGDSDDNASRVWSLGLRNPFSVAVQADGDLFIGDVGWGTVEEINRVATGGTGGGSGEENFGWPWYEGRYTGANQTNGYRNEPAAGPFYAGETVDGDLTLPVFSRDHSQGARAFIIGDFLEGNAWPSEYRNSLLLVDWNSGVVEAVVLDANDNFVRVETIFTGAGPITSMDATDDGRLYYGRWDGRIGVIDFA